MSIIKMKKSFKYLIFILIVCILNAVIVPIFRDKSIERVSSEYDNFSKETFDVIFVGSSVMMNAVYPLELYEDYGISAFNLGCGSQQFASSYYLIKQAIREQKPKLVVFDVYMAGATDMPDGFTHYVTDSMHYPEKIEMIMNTISRNKRIDYIYELGTYHNRWDILTKDDFVNNTSLNRKGTYGAKAHCFSMGFDGFGDITTKSKTLPEKQEYYLRKIIELCQKNNVDIMLTLMPMDYSKNTGEIDRSQWQFYWNEIQNIADEYKVEYLNFMYHYNELNLDTLKDTDGGTHLNAYGATKMTKYLGGFLKTHYQIEDVRGKIEYGYMEQDLLEFKRNLNVLELIEKNNIEDYIDALNKLKNKKYAIVVSVKDIQGYFLNNSIIRKLKELGFLNADILLEKNYHSFIGTIGVENYPTELYGGDEAIQYSGKINGRDVLVESKTLNTGNQSKIVIENTDYSKNFRGLNFVVIDKENGEIVDTVAFDTHVPEWTCFR